MRPVKKGRAPRTYTKYGDAVSDLVDRLGIYCSYCEMNISNSPEVEHVVPRARGGANLSWGNFLLSCKQCNIHKHCINTGREDYMWPDKDNTLLATSYTYPGIIEASPALGAAKSARAKATINLCGLDKVPGAPRSPTIKDLRWAIRFETWEEAKSCLKSLIKNPTDVTENLIVSCALGRGFFSIWFNVFQAHPRFIKKLISAFKGTDAACFSKSGKPVSKGRM